MVVWGRSGCRVFGRYNKTKVLQMIVGSQLRVEEGEREVEKV